MTVSPRARLRGRVFLKPGPSMFLPIFGAPPMMRPPISRLVLLLTLLLTIAKPGGRCIAQEDVPLQTLADLVPPTATIYLQLDGLSDPARQAQLAGLWNIVKAAGHDVGWSSSAEDDDPTRGSASDWNTLVADVLGLSEDNKLGDIFGTQVALAATDWGSFADGVVLVRIESDRGILSLLDPAHVSQTRRRGHVLVRRTKSGLWIAEARDNTVLSIKSGPGSLFDEVVGLLNHADRPSLGRSEAFRSEVSLVAPGHAALLYFEKPAPSPGHLPTLLTTPLAALARGSAALHLDDNRATIVLRSLLVRPRRRETRPQVDVNVQRRLPQGTLLAWSSSHDEPSAGRMVSAAGIGFWRRILGIRPGQHPQLDRMLDDWMARLVRAFESRITMVFGPDELSADPSPALSLVMETSDPSATYAELRDILIEFGELLDAGSEASAAAPTLRIVQHLGHEICQVTTTNRRGDSAARSWIGSLWGSMEPCFSAVDEGIVFSTHQGQLRQILDARDGVAPSLQRLRPLTAGGTWDTGVVVLAFAQPALASHMLGEWMASAMDHQSTSPLDSDEPAPAPSDPTVEHLGIRVTPTDRAGTLEVVAVADDGPSRGQLQTGDRIIGVQGRVLSLNQPVTSLDEALTSEALPAVVVVRVERGQTILDVVLKPAPGTSTPSTSVPTSGDPFERLRAALRPMAFAAYRVYPTPTDRYQADLTLHLLPSNPTPNKDAGAQQLADPDPAPDP